MDTSKLIDELTGRVRDALSDAESRAATLVSEAEARARQILADAEAEAKSIRERAEAEADQRLAKVRAALAGLEGALTPGSTPDAEVEPGPVPVPEPSPPPIPEPSPPPVPEPTPPAEPEPMPPEPEIEPPAPAQPDRSAPEAQPSMNGSAPGRSADQTAARIVATKMALDGSSRDEIAAHLTSNYDVEGAEKLADDVLARARK